MQEFHLPGQSAGNLRPGHSYCCPAHAPTGDFHGLLQGRVLPLCSACRYNALPVSVIIMSSKIYFYLTLFLPCIYYNYVVAKGGGTMKTKERIDSLLRDYPENTLIFADRIYREKFSGELSEAAYYQVLSRMCKTGEIIRISKGIYCRPKVSKFGMVPPSEKELVQSFTENEQGVVVGYTLYNELKLTTQVPKRVYVYSSLPEEQCRQIGNVVLQKHDVKFTPEVCSFVRMMDVLQHYGQIQELNRKQFLEVCSEFVEQYNVRTADYVLTNMHYPKRTLAFMREVLDYYGKKHTLDRRLSSLSDYKIPKMEALYEAARKSI